MGKISKCVLIVDGNNISWRAAAIVGDDLTKRGADNIPTTMIDSMLNKRIREMKSDEWYDEVIPLITFDLPSSMRDTNDPDDAKINRWTFYTDYKANRRDDHEDEEHTSEINERNAWRLKWENELTNDGTTVLGHPGTEADDLMSYTANRISNLTDDDVDVALWTSDKDLMQVVNDDKRVFMYRKRKNRKTGVMEETKVDEKEVLREKGVPVSKMRAQLALLGDSADNYHGIMQYGGKRGVNVVNASDGTYPSLLDELLKDEEKRLARKIKSGEVDWPSFRMNVADQLDRNWTLAGCGADYMGSTALEMADAAVDDVITKL